MPTKQVTEVIFGYGHENVQATHHSTIEFTKDTFLSRNGDCILVVATDKGLSDLSAEFKTELRKPHAALTVRIEAGDVSEEIHAQGSTQLALSHPVEMVLRKSNFASDRTLGVGADKAAEDLSRQLVEKLRNPEQKAKITLTVRD